MRSVPESLREYARGVAGGLLFSLPLLYTMEVWWAGFTVGPLRLVGYVLASFLLLLGYNRYAGLHEDASFLEVVTDSVEEMGLGLLLGAGILWLLGLIDGSMPAVEVVGKVVVESMTVAIGISVGKEQLGGEGAHEDEGYSWDRDAREDSGEQDGGAEGKARDPEPPSFWGQLVLGLCGAVLFAANVAPTEEIPVIAAGMTPWQLLALAVASILLGAGILHHSNFRGAEENVPASGAGEMFVGVTCMYAVALAASATILWFFGRFDGTELGVQVAQTVVLGLPGTMGASAGRLLLQ